MRRATLLRIGGELAVAAALLAWSGAPAPPLAAQTHDTAEAQAAARAKGLPPERVFERVDGADRAR